MFEMFVLSIMPFAVACSSVIVFLLGIVSSLAAFYSDVGVAFLFSSVVSISILCTDSRRGTS